MCAMFSRGARGAGYALCVEEVLMLTMASWLEAHISGRTDHNRWERFRGGMGSL